MELMQPAESMSVYDLDPKGATTFAGDQLRWFRTAVTGASRPVRSIAENVVGLIIWPKLAKGDESARLDQGRSPLSPNYIYDSSLLTFKSPRFGTAVSPVYLNEGAKLTSTTDLQDAAQINPKNQLPPIVQVTLIALDEQSAARLEDQPKGSAVEDLSKGLFEVACSPGTRSNQETRYDQDLQEMQQRMVKAGLTYRVFTSDVVIRAAKWSASQTK